MGYVEMIALGKAKHDGCGLTRYGFGINVHAQLIAQLSAQIQANSCGALDASSVTPYKTLIKNSADFALADSNAIVFDGQGDKTAFIL